MTSSDRSVSHDGGWQEPNQDSRPSTTADPRTDLPALLGQWQDLYDRNRFLELYRRSSAYWTPGTNLEQLSVPELILGGRLALRLGGGRLSRWLFRAALQRDPLNPRVRYFSRHVVRRRLLEELREFEEQPDLGGDDDELRAAWLAAQAATWASLREFDRAFECIAKARTIAENDSWVLSCEADVLVAADRYTEALQVAEQACQLGPGLPHATTRLGMILLNLGRVEEAALRLAAAAENSESYEVAGAACWHQCALAETLEGGSRRQAIIVSGELMDTVARLAPLADRDTECMFARMRLDIADLADDHAEMERWLVKARSPFHRKVLANLRNNPSGVRLRLPYRREIQKYQTCLPASLASALAAQGISIEPEKIAVEITFGGTSGWAAADWLQQRGFSVRFFTVTPELAVRLVANGIAFVASWEGDDFAHAVAIVGVDEAAGTLLVHDPNSFRGTEYLLEGMNRGQAPLGPKGLAAVPLDQASRLDQLLAEDSGMLAAAEEQQKAFALGGPSAGRSIVLEACRRHPAHPGARMLQAIQAQEDGRTGEALTCYEGLLNEFPESASARRGLLSACHTLGNTALLRQTLRAVVERGTLPGVRSQQDWDHPPARYVSEYADLLRVSADTRQHAAALLHSVLRRSPNSSDAWHNLGDLLWDTQDIQGALLAYRLACCNAEDNEHYARALCDALASQGREQEGLKGLEARVHTSGMSARAVPTWSTWIGALEDFGHPQRALDACQQALQLHGNAPQLLAFAVQFLARMGQWDRAEETLKRLESSNNPASFHQAATEFQGLQGALDLALHHAEAWVREVPQSMPARYALLGALKRREGSAAAVKQAARWTAEQPRHDDLEAAYYGYLDWPPGAKYRVLRRRSKRNPEDSWAWREVAASCINQYDTGDERLRRRLDQRLAVFLAQCDRTSADEAATRRIHALWYEARGEWPEAAAVWLQAIERNPGSFYLYRRAWECSMALDSEKRRQVWEGMESLLLTFPGRLSLASEMISLLARYFGVDQAEQTIERWRQLRPDDPEVLYAACDLLLEHGHGRSDAARALEILKSAIEHYPFHVGLRLLLAYAHRALGQHEEAEAVLREAVRRHPANSGALIQLVWAYERGAKQGASDEVMEAALVRDPHNPEVWDARTQVLIGRGCHQQVQTLVEEGLQRMPESVYWREQSIERLVQCGAWERAVQVARQGTEVFPRGAYLWLLLGRTLNQWRRGAAPGEIESCLRRSLALNRSLFESADLLTIVLVEQRRYDEATVVMQGIRPRLADPSPVRGRLAWIKRQQGHKREAMEEMASAVQVAPWYFWGWLVLMDWFEEDKVWDDARKLLGTIPLPLRTNPQFRSTRLRVLDKAGLEAGGLDAEWDSLLRDFPENFTLHLDRYDLLRDTNRRPEASTVLHALLPSFPDNPYVQARLVESLLEDKRNEEALRAALRVWFTPVEESTWPADKVRASLESAGLAAELYRQARDRLERGQQPTPRALGIMAEHAVKIPDPVAIRLRTLWHPRAHEVITLLEMIDRAHWTSNVGRALVLDTLNNHGHWRMVVRYWEKNRAVVEQDVNCLAHTGRALLSLSRKREARALFSTWRERAGVAMWMVTNYIAALPRNRSGFLEALASCRDALAGLPHDHCARYLAHIQAEACALLGDTTGLLQTWSTNRVYFQGTPEQNEWFEPRRRHLLGDIPILVRLLEQNETWLYRRKVWSLRWQHLWESPK